MAPTDTNDAPNAFDSTDNTRDVDENSMNGTLVGSPVATTDSNPSDVLTYTIPDASDAESVRDRQATGQISVGNSEPFRG